MVVAEPVYRQNPCRTKPSPTFTCTTRFFMTANLCDGPLVVCFAWWFEKVPVGGVQFPEKSIRPMYLI